MGSVFNARNATLGRTIALKLVRAGASATPEDVERFRRESVTMASLRHPNIVPLLGSGDVDGFRYFSMPHVEGKQPSSAAFSGDWKRMARVVAKVASAVQFVQ